MNELGLWQRYGDYVLLGLILIGFTIAVFTAL